MPRKKSSSNYFTKETEEYIVKYNTSSDEEYRARIFTEHIYFPFYKLVENIIHTFKFYYTDIDSIENLKHELISILLEEKIMKFDPTNGAKAYSYFGTIVKRWLINYNNKNYKKLKQIGSFDSYEDYYVPTTDQEVAPGSMTLANYMDSWVEETYDKLEVMFEKESDMVIADAILTIFKTRHDLEIFKKKALYIYIREMTDCKTPNLTKVLQVLKADFYEKYLIMYEQGLISVSKE